MTVVYKRSKSNDLSGLREVLQIHTLCEQSYIFLCGAFGEERFVYHGDTEARRKTRRLWVKAFVCVFVSFIVKETCTQIFIMDLYEN